MQILYFVFILINLVQYIYTNQNVIQTNKSLLLKIIETNNSTLIPNSEISNSSLSSTTETIPTNKYEEETNTQENKNLKENKKLKNIHDQKKENDLKILATSTKISISSSISSISRSATWPRKVSKKCTCGIQNNENTLVDPMPHSWTVGITRNENSPIVCSGSLINNQYVLTTANCARMVTGNSRIIIVAPESANNQTSEIDDQSPFFETYTISDVKINPKFITNLTNVAKYALRNDIALIRLNEKIDFSLSNTRASAICLPTLSTPYLDSLNVQFNEKKNYESENIIDHESVAITGYALISFNERNELTDDYRQNTDTRYLWARQASILSSKECKQIWQQFYTKGKSLCTFSKHNGLCEGSLGSSLSVLRFGREHMVGLQSLGSRQCGRSSMPDLFVDVAPYLNWIYKNTVDAVYCSEQQN